MARGLSDLPAEHLYKQRTDEFAEQASELARHDRKLTFGRAITFLAGASSLALAGLDAYLRSVWVAIGLILILAFLALAIYQEWLQRRRRRCRHLQYVNRKNLDRCSRDWRSLKEKTVEVPREHEAIARDLDLFGRCSLFQLINLTHTPRGVAMLSDWLLMPASPAEIVGRQAAVQQLKDAWPLREELALRGEMLAESVTGPEAFEQWAESPRFLKRHPRLKWLSRLLPATTLAVAMALSINLLPPEIGVFALLVMLLANVLFSVLFVGEVQDIFNNISTRCGELQHYLALFELLGQIPTGSTRLETIQEHAVHAERGAVHQLARLRAIMRLADLRHGSLLGAFYFVLQATILWDFHVLFLLERWQKRCGRQVRYWFDALAEMEALASLSQVAFDNPSWTFAEVDSSRHDRFQAAGLGHPLLTAKVRVSNDVEVGPAGTVLLVTGSNMSGKSTLLRAIGLNAVLAQAGAPVCAESLRMPSLAVTTSMRIQDSLEDGVSFFMAELQRLKKVVDQATDYASRGSYQLLYLLDEILQGTNSVERHIAVSRVLAHLVEAGAMGAVSTHDLDLANSKELSQACRAVHFQETLHGRDQEQQMTFDYRLRPGVATTTNALKLLELVGLD